MDATDPSALWQAELLARLRRGLKLDFYFAISIFLIFISLDFLIFPEVAVSFLELRVLCAAGYVPFLVALRFARGRRSLVALGIVSHWWLSAAICAMLTMTGYEASLYYVGLVLVIFGMSVLVPWTWKELVATGLGMVLLYDGVVLLNPGKVYVAAALNGNFFLLGTIGIAVTYNVTSLRLARSEFLGRHELAQALDKLKDLDRMKSNFMANISHEMRTPLTLVLGSLETLVAGELVPVQPAQVEYLRVMQRNGLALLRLIDDLLDLARVEAAQMRLRLEEIDLVEMVRGIAEQASPLFAWRSIELALDLPDRPIPILLDAQKADKVVLNLLSNALKFTPPQGRVRLAVDEEDGQARVVVEDSGIGIPPEEHERIFERFSQVDADSTRQRGGTGIGLALVKEFVELHGGRVSVASEPGRGSTFTVVWPKGAAGIPPDRIDRRVASVDTVHARRETDLGLGDWARRIAATPEYRFGDLYQAADRRSAPRIEGGPREGTVLVVEDSDDVIHFLSLQLGPHYKIVTARNGLEGWARVQAERPDVVLTDLMMPERDGLWLIREIRGHPETRSLPVVMLTARIREEDRISVREGGADVYLAKPFSPRELLAAVRGLMSRRQDRVRELQDETATSLQVLVSGMAHELMNPLSFISTALFALEEQLGELLKLAAAARKGESTDGFREPADLEHRSRRLIHAGRVGVDRIRVLGEALKEFSRPDGGRPPEPVDLNTLVRSTVALVAPGEEASHRFHFDLCEQATVPCRIGSIQQVVLNLVKNALLALGEGGEIRIGTRWRDEGVEVAIADTGCGIPQATLARVFDPFMTTRPPGAGMGLGLTLSRKIVEEHGGELRLESVVGEGTRAIVWLPAAPCAAAIENPIAGVADAGPADSAAPGTQGGVP